jgi:hypothetical protein
MAAACEECSVCVRLNRSTKKPLPLLDNTNGGSERISYSFMGARYKEEW